jgi:hypothetical protein
MTSSRKGLMLVAFVGLLSLTGSRGVQAAAPRSPAAERERFVQLLESRRSGGHVKTTALGSGNFSRNIAAFNRMIAKQGPTPPRIPRSLLVQPRPTRTAALAAARQRKILALYRTRASLHGGVAGGVYFSPPAGTPYYPVAPSNIFTYFPVYRA